MSVPRDAATVGDLLRAYRLAAGLTQEALAKRSGVSPRSIQLLEAGSVRPRRSTVVQLAEALGLSGSDREAFEGMVTPSPRRPTGPDPGFPRDMSAAVDRFAAPVLDDPADLHSHALVALPRSAPTNIPWPVSSLIGREGDVAALHDVIVENRQRLVTLTGGGGSGKTRLAVQVAVELLDTFADGTWFVELAPTSSPALVPGIVAGTLGVREVENAPILDTLLGFLRRKSVLLILDNCEHLVDACASLADRLLTACPDLHVLATSREPLSIVGEQRWQVSPLTVPDVGGGRAASVEVLAESPAVRLFVERAQAIEGGFRLTEQNVASVVRVCARLDGIPLAIELAASRIQVLSAEQIAARLDEGFRVLAATTRAGPTRQQTMQAALDWSYDLLAPSERALFRVLSTFAGGFDLEAAERVGSRQSAVGSRDSIVPVRPEDGPALPTAHCPLPWGSRGPMVGRPAGPTVLDTLGRLVDKSLVVAERVADGRRYRLLEPVRQYAQQALLAAGEDAGTRARHAAHYAALAERAAPLLRGPEQVAWQARLAREQDNLRAALHWADERDEIEAVARLALALVPFWEVQGSLREGRRWLDSALVATSLLPDELRANVLHGTGRLAFWQVDLAAAAARFDESLALARELGDQPAVATAITWLGAVRGGQGAFAEAELLLHEGLALHEALGDESGAAWALFNLGRAVGNLGGVTRSQGDLARAVSLLEAGLRRYRALGDVRLGAMAATFLGPLLLRLDERERAVSLLREGLASLRMFGDQAYLFPGLLTLAFVAALTDQPVRAAYLLGGAETIAQALGTTLSPVNRVTQESVLAAIRPHLDAAAIAEAQHVGQEMSLAVLMAEAWAVADDAR